MLIRAEPYYRFSPQLITIAAQQFGGALGGSTSAKNACAAAQKQWIQVLRSGGHLK